MFNEKFKLHCLAALISSLPLVTAAAPSSSSPYNTAPQSSYNKDQTYETFSFVGVVACMIKAMGPEKMIGAGQYLAWADEAKCKDSVSAGNGNSGAQTNTTNFSQAILTSVLDASDNLLADVFLVLRNDDNTIEHIQVKTKISAGPAVMPPYGKWEMDFCSSTVGQEGNCNNGRGLVRVNGANMSVYQDNGNAQNFRSGTASFSDTKNGKGAIAYGGGGQTGSTKFVVAPGKYLVQDSQANQPTCANPEMSDPSAKFSVWENYLYDDTGNLVTYTNQGFRLKDSATQREVGYASYWGVNIWSDAPNNLNTSNLIDGDGNSFSLHTAPGTLEEVKTSQVSLSDMDGITFNMWLNGNGVGTATLLNSKAGVTINNSSNYNLVGAWNHANQRLVISGYQECGNSGCSITNFSSNATATLAELIQAGIQGFGGWVDGAGVNYNAQIANWNNGQLTAIAVNQVKVIKETRRNLTPGSPDIPSSLVCVGNCATNSGSSLTDANTSVWPPTLSYTYDWDATAGAPVIHGTNIALDYSTGQQSKYFQLFNSSDITAMQQNCQGWSNGSSYSGYCPWNVTQSANATYYSWRSGSTWDSYKYLTNNSNSQVVSFDPPLMLSYTVPSVGNLPQGVDPSYAGKTITVQSPGPGQLWLPGHCIDSSGNRAQCGEHTDWVSDVYIPFSTGNEGKVTMLNSNGSASNTQYYVKWSRRGVHFAAKAASNCTGLTLPTTELTPPTLSDWSNPASSMTWNSSLNFNAAPKVIDGKIQ